MRDRFLIDECLSGELVATAKARGYEADYVPHLGKGGWPSINPSPVNPMHYPDAIALAATLKGADTDPAEFYAVDDADVAEAEARLSKPFPDGLKYVWKDLGSGFFYSFEDEGLRSGRVLILMPPEQIADIVEIHDDRFGDDVPFFDIHDDEFLVLKPDGTIENAAWPGVVIASSMIDFIERMFDDPLFWVALAPGDDP